ncbi:unknown [Clostridium sp. CAG:594]|nr:unknown [Clostridium sp. CAG:594]
MYEKSLKILGLSGNFDRMDLEVAYNKAKQKSKNNLSNEKIIKVIEDAYNYLLEDMLNKEEVKINIDNLPKQESMDIRLITLIKALEYTLDDESKIDKELRNYDANFEDLDNAIHYFELVNMREALKNLKSRKNK